MVDHLLDRSRFVDRILMDPHNVMNTSSAAGSQQQYNSLLGRASQRRLPEPCCSIWAPEPDE